MIGKYKIFSKKEFVISIILMALLALTSFCIYFNNIPDWFPDKLLSYKRGFLGAYKREYLGAVVTFIGLFWILCSFYIITRKYDWLSGVWNRCRTFIESRAVIILSTFIVLAIIWTGLVIFENPYRSEYNHGNGAYYAHVLHNICSGIGPEQTTKFRVVMLRDYNNPYFFASPFMLAPHILPLFVLVPLYSLYPYPPMHVFSMAIVVILFGAFGVYLAIRAIKGSKTLSLLGAIGYCLIPWVEYPVLFMGAFDNLGLAVYPYVFAFLFSQRWWLFYLALFLLALINLPYAYSVMAIGVVTIVFFKRWKQGIIAFFIGFLVMQWGDALRMEGMCGIWTSEAAPQGLISQFVLGRNFKTLAEPFLKSGFYILNLFMTVTFVPLLGIRCQRKWNWTVIGMLVLMLTGAFMGMFRSCGWTAHRNSLMIVPIYLSAFVTYISFLGKGETNKIDSAVRGGKHILIGSLLFASIISLAFWYSHNYPWAGLAFGNNPVKILKAPQYNREMYNENCIYILDKLKEYIPENASVAYRIESGLQAYIVNRQKAWHFVYSPEGVEYYFIQKKKLAYININLPPWQERHMELEYDNNLQLLYRDDMLDIYKNLNPKPIPRLESVLGWDLLLKAIIPGRSCNSSD